MERMGTDVILSRGSCVWNTLSVHRNLRCRRDCSLVLSGVRKNRGGIGCRPCRLGTGVSLSRGACVRGNLLFRCICRCRRRPAVGLAHGNPGHTPSGSCVFSAAYVYKKSDSAGGDQPRALPALFLLNREIGAVLSCIFHSGVINLWCISMPVFLGKNCAQSLV